MASERDSEIERIARELLGIPGFSAVMKPEKSLTTAANAKIQKAMQQVWDAAFEQGTNYGQELANVARRY